MELELDHLETFLNKSTQYIFPNETFINDVILVYKMFKHIADLIQKNQNGIATTELNHCKFNSFNGEKSL